MRIDNEPNDTYTNIAVMLILACIIALFALLSTGCNPIKQMDKQPGLAARYCADKFPARETVVHDTLWNDSIRTALVDTLLTWRDYWGDNKPVIDTKTQDQIKDDSRYIKLASNCEECVRTIHMLQDRIAVIRRNYMPPVTTTRTVVDSAAVVYLRNELGKANQAATEYLKMYQTKDVELIAARGKLRSARYIIGGLLLLIFGAIFFTIKRKK